MDENNCIGIVVNCMIANVYRTPDIGSRIVTIAECLEKVTVDLGQSTDDWYKVQTEDGVEGFCISEYIALCQN